MAVTQARKTQLVWDTTELRAKAMPSGSQSMEEGFSFVDAHLLDYEVPTDVFDGILEIDLDLADAKFIDDGATVAGAFRDEIETERQLADTQAELGEAHDEIARLQAALDKVGTTDDDRTPPLNSIPARGLDAGAPPHHCYAELAKKDDELDTKDGA